MHRTCVPKPPTRNSIQLQATSAILRLDRQFSIGVRPPLLYLHPPHVLTYLPSGVSSLSLCPKLLEHLITHSHSYLLKHRSYGGLVSRLEEVLLIHSLVGVDGRVHEAVRIRFITIVLFEIEMWGDVNVHCVIL